MATLTVNPHAVDPLKRYERVYAQHGCLIPAQRCSLQRPRFGKQKNNGIAQPVDSGIGHIGEARQPTLPERDLRWAKSSIQPHSVFAISLASLSGTSPAPCSWCSVAVVRSGRGLRQPAGRKLAVVVEPSALRGFSKASSCLADHLTARPSRSNAQRRRAYPKCPKPSQLLSHLQPVATR